MVTLLKGDKMWCGKCNKELRTCTCPDLKERLENIAKNPYMLSKWCSKCDNHHSKCRCEEPNWYTR